MFTNAQNIANLTTEIARIVRTIFALVISFCSYQVLTDQY